MSAVTKQIKYAAIISYAAIIINIVITLLYTPWMVDKIGTSNYALYTLANTLISVFMMDFGIGSVVSRFISKYRAEGQEEKVNDLLGIVSKIFLLIDLLIVVILAIVFLFLEQIYQGLTTQEIETFRWVFIVVAINNVISFPFMALSGIFNAYERFIELKLCDLFQRIFSIVLVVISIAVFCDVVILVSCYAVSSFFTIAIKLIILKKKEPQLKIKIKYKNKDLLKQIFSFSVWVAISTLMQRMYFNIAPSILGIISNSTEIAIFAPAASIESYFYTIATAISGLFLPTISRMIVEDKTQIQGLLENVGKFQIFVTCFMFVGLFTVGRDFMILWMGKDFEKAYYCIIILILPSVITIPQQIANTYAIAENQVKSLAIADIIATIFCVVLAFWVGSRLGAIGSSIAISVAYFIKFIAYTWIYQKKLHLRMGEFFRKCYLRMLVPVLICLGLGVLINYFLQEISYLNFFVKVISIAVIYMLCVGFIGYSKNDRKKAIAFIKHKKKKEENDNEHI